MMTKDQIGQLIGDFTYMFGQFFIATKEGNFLWSDPGCNGNNTISLYNGSYKDFAGRGYGRAEGVHKICEYIGDDWEGLTIVESST